MTAPATDHPATADRAASAAEASDPPESEARLRLLQDLALAANAATVVSEAMAVAMARICAFGGWSAAHLYQVAGDDPGRLLSTDLWHLDDPKGYRSLVEATRGRVLAVGEGLPGRVLESGEAEWIPDVRQADVPRLRDDAERGVGAALGIPVLSGRRVVGVLEFFSPSPLPADPLLLGISRHIGAMLGQVVERERTHHELRRQREMLLDAQRIAGFGSWEWHVGSDRIEWSPELYRIFGVEPENFRADYQSYLKRLHPEDRERITTAVSRALATGEGYSVDHRVVQPDGAVRYVHSEARVLQDERGRPARLVGTAHDVTDRVEAERRERELLGEQVRRAEAEAERRRLYRLFMEAPASIIFTRGPEHVVELANRAVQRESPGIELAGRPLGEALPAAGEQGFVALLDRVFASGEPYVGREVPAVRRRDGGSQEGFFDFVFQPIRNAAGQVHGILIHSVEVTASVEARREVERKAGELERLAARLAKINRDLDQFAYIASHDLRAPLRGISNLSQWLEEELADTLTGEPRRYLELLRNRVARMDALINGILEYSRAGRMEAVPEPVDVGALVRETVELIDPPQRAVVEIAPDLPVLETPRAPLSQVFLNLIGNALKHARRDDPRVEVTGRAVDGEWEFSVRDNGPGIAPAYHAKVWQIFQTLEARDDVESTGIGLAVVRKLVEDREGRVAIDSDPGREPGTTFRFTWPALAEGLTQ
ncbi:MAG TPA: PAS domain-containing protein [Thermoanaerobaculia bacterium]|nr:PAS domain-containing protein [Thermoanaerobaculia bacterium]